MDNKKASLNLDILVNGRFYRQLRYNGFYEVVDGQPVFDHLHVERFVE